MTEQIEAVVTDTAELLLTALLDLLPIEGSWNNGFKVSETFDPTVKASPEEWATAAQHACELHALLALDAKPEQVEACERCRGKGTVESAPEGSADVIVPCPTCGGSGKKPETVEGIPEEARKAAWDAHLRYQARPAEEWTEDGWMLALLQAAAPILLAPLTQELSELRKWADGARDRDVANWKSVVDERNAERKRAEQLEQKLASLRERVRKLPVYADWQEGMVEYAGGMWLKQSDVLAVLSDPTTPEEG